MRDFRFEMNWWLSNWTDESAYVLHARTSSGFRFGSQVADVGRAEIVLDNAGRRFSPGNSSSPLYGLLLPRKQVRLKNGSTVVWRGYIERIEPSAGEWGPDTCLLVCVDGLGLLDQQRVGTALQSTIGANWAVYYLVDSAYTPPVHDYVDNGDYLTHYGRTLLPESMTVREALRDVCETVYGRFWVARDGTTKFWSRNEVQDNSVDSALTVSASDPVSGVELGLDVARIINRVQVTAYPVETLVASQVLWKAQTVLRIGAGETRVIYGLYRDPNGERCGAIDVLDPVATTDYRVNEKADGTGPDYTTAASFVMTTTHEATRTAFTIVNNATGPVYVRLLQVRGKPLVSHDPITVQYDDSTSQTAYGVRAQALRLPMQTDQDWALNYAQYLVGRYAEPVVAGKTLTVKNLATVGGVDPLSIELMDKIDLAEPQSGFSAAGHWVTGLEYEITPRDWTMKAHLERADETNYWLLGKLWFSGMGAKTRLGF